jgi:hypothetical protein
MDESSTSFTLEMSGHQNLNKFFMVLQFFSKVSVYVSVNA